MARSVRVMLHSGLGNQMFMYAAGRALSLRIGASLTLDVSRFPVDRVYFRTYALEQFPIQAHLAMGGVLSARVPLGLKLRVERRVRGPLVNRMCGFINEEAEGDWVKFEDRIVSRPPRRSLVLSGFWQSERYFADCSDLVREELTPVWPDNVDAVADLAMIEGARHPVAIGLRFYLEKPGSTSNHNGIIAAYRQVVGEYSKTNPDATYFVFTERPEFFTDPDCLGVPFRLITHRTRDKDAWMNMYCMARCRDFIISFSSYHWWGAWLGRSQMKRVVYLRFNGQERANYVPEKWAIVDVTDA